MSDFSDLVKKLNAISNNEETVSAAGDTVYKPVEEAVSGTRETASILKVFNEIQGERAQVAEAEEVAEGYGTREFEVDGYTYMTDLDREEDNQKISHMIKTPDGKIIQVDFTPYAYMTKDDVEFYIKLGMPKRQGVGSLNSEQLQKMAQIKGVAEAFPNPGSGSTGSSKEDKRIAAALRKKHIPTTPNDKKEKGVAEAGPFSYGKAPRKGSVAEDKANEDVLGDIASRYRDFMKSEVAQGNDLTTVDSAVKEATSSATAIDDSFQKIFDMMGRLMKVTAEGAVLSKMVDREGGDAAWIADAHQKLIEAMEALEEAHMYSNPPREDD